MVWETGGDWDLQVHWHDGRALEKVCVERFQSKVLVSADLSLYLG